jgi:hypothetical protein
MTYHRDLSAGGIDTLVVGQLRGSRQWEDFFAASQLYSVWNLAGFGARPRSFHAPMALTIWHGAQASSVQGNFHDR